MIVRNGVQLGHEVAGRGFFELFYRWSRLGCSGQRSYTHTKLPSRTPHKRPWRPIPPSRAQLRHNSTSNTNKKAADTTHNTESSSQVKKEANKIRHINLPANPIRHIKVLDKPPVLRYMPHSYPTPPDTPRTYTAPPPPAVSPLTSSLRAVLRTLPHPIVILTTALPTSISPKVLARQKIPRRRFRNCRAMTISSFTSVSLPEGEGKEPIISFNIKSPSITLDALSTSRWFLIHVLEATAEGARLAGGFTHGGGGREWFDGAALRELEPESEGKIPGRGIRVVEEVIGKHPVMEADIVLPRLEGRGVKMVLKCEVASGYRVQPKDQGFIKVGDHVVCLGVVKEVYGGMEGGQEEALGYAEGVYRGVGEAIDVEGG